MRLFDLFETKNRRSLYVCRPVLNSGDLHAWARSQGFPSVLAADELHVTIAYSKAKVNWRLLAPDTQIITIPPSTDRKVKPLGGGGAVVLGFTSPELHARWQALCDAGCSWDFPTYDPHVSITYKGKKIDVNGMEPYRGAIVLGPEQFEPLDPDAGHDAKEIRLNPLTESASYRTGGFWVTDEGEIEMCDHARWRHHADVARELLGVDPADYQDEYTEDTDEADWRSRDAALTMAYLRGWIRGTWMIDSGPAGGSEFAVNWRETPNRAAARALLAFWRDGHAKGFQNYVVAPGRETHRFHDPEAAYAFLRQALKG